MAGLFGGWKGGRSRVAFALGRAAGQFVLRYAALTHLSAPRGFGRVLLNLRPKNFVCFSLHKPFIIQINVSHNDDFT